MYLTIGFNIRDAEQRRDLEYIYASPNRAGRIRECVRMARLGHTHVSDVDVTMMNSNIVIADDDDILDVLI